MGAPLESMAAMGGVGEEQRAMNQAAMGGVGEEQRAMDQAAMDRQMAQYQYETTAPQQALQQYLGNISGQYGGTSQTTPGAMDTIAQAATIAAMLGTL